VADGLDQGRPRRHHNLDQRWGRDAQLSIDAVEIGVVMPLEPSGGHATVQFGFQSQIVDLSASSWQPRHVVALQDFGGLGTQQVHIQPRGDGRVDLDEVIVLN
jgi:hypothetical protein